MRASFTDKDECRFEIEREDDELLIFKRVGWQLQLLSIPLDSVPDLISALQASKEADLSIGRAA